MFSYIKYSLLYLHIVYSVYEKKQLKHPSKYFILYSTEECKW